MNTPIDSTTENVLNTVAEAIVSRRSVRAFLPTPIDKKQVYQILEIAARAPSGTNTQPWKVYALSGEAKDHLCEAVLTERENQPEGAPEYSYYPKNWRDPYLARRRKVGWDLYGLLNIAKEDKQRMWAQFGRNYLFFDAPVGLIFTIDRDLEVGSWLDYGTFLQNIMIVARGFGLDTCPQASWISYPDTVAKILSLSKEEMVVCGMALGYADPSKPEDSLITSREPVDSFTQFSGF